MTAPARVVFERIEQIAKDFMDRIPAIAHTLLPLVQRLNHRFKNRRDMLRRRTCLKPTYPMLILCQSPSSIGTSIMETPQVGYPSLDGTVKHNNPSIRSLAKS